MTEIKTDSHRVNGIELAYLESGSGPLVVLLHGFPDNAWSWEYQRRALAGAGYRVVAPFLRGYPPSEIPAEPAYDALTLGADLNGLIEALGEGPARVAGHDFGAMAVYGALAQPGHRIERAAVLAVSHPAHFIRVVQHPALVHHGFHIWFLAHPGIGDVGAAHDDMALIDYLWRRWSGESDEREHVERVKRETLRRPGALTAALDYYRAMVGRDGRPGLAPEILQPIDVPMLAIYGADDPVPQVLAPGEEELYNALYQRVDVPGAHHFVHRAQPEAVTNLLVEWYGTDPADLVETAGRPRSSV
jgi:pimeloyl-ACP methyl ester carboxylesterase